MTRTRARRPPSGPAPLLVFLLGLCHAVVARASPELDAWRVEAAHVRALADNDTAAALRDAKRLERALPADATPGDRARLLNLFARIELYRAETAQAADHARQARALAERQGDRVGQVEADLTLVTASVNLADIDASYEATTHALTLVDGLERPELVAEAMLHTALMYQRRGRLDELVTTALQAVEIARRSQSPLALAYAQKAVAIGYQQSGREAEARVHFAEMLDLARAAGSSFLEADALLGLATAGGGAADVAAVSERRGREAIALYRRIDAPFSLCTGLFALADLQRRDGRPHEALEALDEAAAIYDRHPNRLGLWWTLNLRARVLRMLRRTAPAMADVERAYALAQESGVSFYRSESAKQLAELAAERGDHRRAYAYLTEANEMAARTAREGASARILELARRYESESKQRQLDDLARRGQEQAAQLRQRDLRQRWLWTLLGGSAVALALTAYFLVRLRRSHRLLAAANAQLQRSQDALERRVADRTAELEAANRELEAFAYSVSHDLRAPVRHIDGFTGLLAKRSEHTLDAQGRHYLDSISGAARRMGALIDDLLAFSRMSRSEMTRGSVDLGALAHEVVRDLAAEARGRAVEWQVGDLPVVTGSRAMLRLVLVNLVSNALKYTLPRERARIEIGAGSGEAGEVVVFVRDNGVGFDMRYAGKLFGVFQRLHPADEFEGTGIGLATVRRIVTRHGGRTWGTGEVGVGATFYFSLPAPPLAEVAR
jgi:signal transduction histidine kinase